MTLEPLYLGREKYTVDASVITKPNDKHIESVLKKLGIENAKPCVLPGRTLDLSTAGNMEFASEKDKETYALCVGSAIYLSQGRAYLKFAVKELARHSHAPRRCDFQNLKLFARYLVGTKHYGHVNKLAEGIGLDDPLPLHAYTDTQTVTGQVVRKCVGAVQVR